METLNPGSIVRVDKAIVGNNYEIATQRRARYGLIDHNQDGYSYLLMIVDKRPALDIKERYYKLIKEKYHLFCEDRNDYYVDLALYYYTREYLSLVGEIKSIEELENIKNTRQSYILNSRNRG